MVSATKLNWKVTQRINGKWVVVGQTTGRRVLLEVLTFYLKPKCLLHDPG